MILIRLALIPTGALCLSACAITPPVTANTAMCGFPLTTEEVAQPPVAPPDRLLLEREPANAQLLISGGSQHGAFGAGVLAEWKLLNGGHLPRFSLVTGISTGAMLSTFAFLDEPETAARAYAITAERDLLTAYAHKTASGGYTLGSYPAIARHSAVGDLAPLRALLGRLITLDTLQRVADASHHRRLLVGAVDVDSGDAVIFDLTEMARRATSATDARLKERYRNCYISAIMASGSVPLAAAPVFIDNREYIDGGARFGVFANEFGLAAGLGSTDRLVPAAPKSTLRRCSSWSTGRRSSARNAARKLVAAPRDRTRSPTPPTRIAAGR